VEATEPQEDRKKIERALKAFVRLAEFSKIACIDYSLGKDATEKRMTRCGCGWF